VRVREGFRRGVHVEHRHLLRTEGTDALLTAAKEAGVSRIIAQSFASYRFEYGVEAEAAGERFSCPTGTNRGMNVPAECPMDV